MSVLLLIIGLILFVGLVVVHEWGHFIMARRNGVEVEEFGIGFPPRAKILAKKNGTVYSLNWLPLGGFVKLKGEHDDDTEPGTFGAATLAAKVKIMVAGVFMNLVTAIFLFMILAWVGMPHLVGNQFTVDSDTKYISHAKVSAQITAVVDNSPAEAAGLQKDDEILAMGPRGNIEKLASNATVSDLAEKYAGQQVVLQVERDNKKVDLTTRLLSKEQVAASQRTDNPRGHLGISSIMQQDGLTVARSTWSAPIVALGIVKQFTQLTFQGLGKALSGVGGIIAGAVTGNTPARQAAQTEASSKVTGPLGIFVILKNGSELGVQFVLMIIAIISLTLAIMNILPIPALDGGRLWLILGARALNKKLSQEREELINGIGFIFLLGLILLITIVDARRFF